MNLKSFLLIICRIISFPLTIFISSRMLNLALNDNNLIFTLIGVVVFIIGVQFTLEFWRSDSLCSRGEFENNLK